jgi:hypothetical protein
MINIFKIFENFKKNSKDETYNIEIQKTCRNLFNTPDGKKVLDWLIGIHILNTTKITDKELLLYNQGAIDLIKKLIIISTYTDKEFFKIGEKND